jgi:hypothetical protein
MPTRQILTSGCLLRRFQGFWRDDGCAAPGTGNLWRIIQVPMEQLSIALVLRASRRGLQRVACEHVQVYWISGVGLLAMPLWQLSTDDPWSSYLCPHVLVCPRHQTLALMYRVENGSRRELPH